MLGGKYGHGVPCHHGEQDAFLSDDARHHHRRRVRYRHRRLHSGHDKIAAPAIRGYGANRIDVYAWGAKNKDWKDFEEYLDSLDEVAAWSPQSQYWDWQNGGVQYRSKKMDSNSSDNGYLQMYFVNEHYGEVTSMSISAGAT